MLIPNAGNPWLVKRAKALAPVRATLLMAGIETELVDTGTAVVASVLDTRALADRELWVTDPYMYEDLTGNHHWTVSLVHVQNGQVVESDWTEGTILEESFRADQPDAILKVTWYIHEWIPELRGEGIV